MTEPYLFERGIGQQMGDLCRLAVGEARVTQTGEIVTLEDMPGRGAFGVSVEVPYTSGGVSAVEVTRCGKNLAAIRNDITTYGANPTSTMMFPSSLTYTFSTLIPIKPQIYAWKWVGAATSPRYFFFSKKPVIRVTTSFAGEYLVDTQKVGTFTAPVGSKWLLFRWSSSNSGQYQPTDIQLEPGNTVTDYGPYNGETYTITLPADFYGGTVNLETGTVTSRYAEDGTELAEPVVTEIDPISIPILAGVNNIWADVGTVTVSYYAADAETFRPALWYPTIYRGLTSARYLIKRASGEIASFDDAIAAPLVGLRVALPYDAEGYQSVSVTVNGTATTITLPTTIYGGYLDVVTGHLVATHDPDGNLLTNQKLYFLDPVNISALAGVNNIWSDAGDVAVSYRIDNG